MGVFYSGLDLGRQRDPSAFAAIEVQETVPDPQRPKMPALRHDCRWLQRWTLGTPYPEICEAVGRMYDATPLSGTTLLVDATGVGLAVYEMLKDHFRRQRLSAVFRPVVITAGFSTVVAADGIHLPKRQLVSALQSVLQGRRLWVADGLPEAEALRKELEAFQLRISESANELFGAESGQHDDIAISLMLPVWLGERRGAHDIWPNLNPEQPAEPRNLAPTTGGTPRPIVGPGSVGQQGVPGPYRRGMFGLGGGPGMGNWQRRGLWGWGS
jgi:hypothetical protein